jgi:hypothetical protein
MSGLEAFLWCLLVLGIAESDLIHARGPALFNDSYQYLSMAANLRDRHSCSTSIIHFDVERVHGYFPAPVTTFPCGYPAAIWAMAWTGLPLEQLAAAVSVLAALATTLLLWKAANLLWFPPTVTRICLLLWAVNSEASVFWTSVATESLFTAVNISALVLLFWAEQRADCNIGYWALPAGFILIGIGYWIRYAGLLIAAAVALYALVRSVQNGTRRLVWVTSLLTLGTIIVAGMLRNVFLAHAWQGGNTKVVHNPVGSVLRKSSVAVYQLILGATWSKSDVRSPLAIICALATTIAVVMLTNLVLQSGRHSWMIETPARRRAVLLLILWLGVYCLGMFYLAFVSPISFGARMFVPTIPVMLLLAGMMLSTVPWGTQLKSAPRKLAAVAVFLFVFGYGSANLACMRRDAGPLEHQLVTNALAETAQNGEKLSLWIEHNIPRGAVLVADDGQATAYVLKRNTVSLVGREFSDLHWDEQETDAVMHTFGADYLILYPGLPARSIPAELESAFLHSLATGFAPSWLELTAQNASVKIFRRLDGLPTTYISNTPH